MCSSLTRLILVLSLTFPTFAAVPSSVYFVENQGQWNGDFRFRASFRSGSAFVTHTGLVLDLRAKDEGGRMKEEFGSRDEGGGMRDEIRKPVSVRGHVLRLTFLDASPCPEMLGLDKLASYSNYFLGRDSSRWKSRVVHYQRVLSQEVWPGINVEYVLKPAGVELVYHRLAGADPAQIQLQIEGLTAPLTLDAAGNLVLPTSLGPLVEQAPTAFQQGRTLPCRYRLTSDSTYSFVLDGYDPQQELVIDPLLYSTFFGGEGWEEFDGFQIDPRDQSLVVSGTTNSSTLPITPGAYQDSIRGNRDIFITRLTADGRSLLFSSYIGGGSGEEYFWCLALTPAGEIYVGGSTRSADWPLSTNAVDTVFAGDIEGYFSRLSADGTTLAFSSYWGGDSGDYVSDLQLDDMGSLYLYGFTESPDFAITANALFTQFQGWSPAYISVFNPTITQLHYSSFFPGTGGIYARRLVVLAPMQVWIVGKTTAGGIVITQDALQPEMQDDRPAFLAKLNLSAGVVEYSSYFGGNDDTEISAIIPLPNDHLFLSGFTYSPNFPVTNGAIDTTHSEIHDYKAFATFLALPATVAYSTLFGMRQPESRVLAYSAVLLPADSSVVLCGTAQGSGFPTTPGTLDSVTGPEWPDAWFAVLSADLSTLRYSTLMGGYDRDYFSRVQVSPNNTVWLAGMSECWDFPVTPDAYQPNEIGWGDGVLCQFSLPWIDAAADPRILHPSAFSLSAYPNPFNSTTEIRYALPRAAYVSLKVYDVLGREVSVLVDEVRAAGEQRAAFDARGLASGIYFVRLDAGEMRVTRKVLLVR